MIPRYYLTYGIGKSGKYLGHFRLGKLFAFYKNTLGYAHINENECINPFRDFQFGGTLLGFSGINYWFPDDTLIGWFLKKIFR